MVGTRVLWWTLAIGLGLLFLFPTPARAETVTIEEYQERLRAAAALLARQANGQMGAALTLAGVRGNLAQIDSLRLPDGRVLSLPPLLQGVASPEVAAARLEAVADQLAMAREDNLAERQALMASILSRKAFGGEGLWERFLAWLRDWLGDWIPQTVPNALNAPAAGAASDILIWAVTIVTLTLVVLLLGYWVQRLMRNFAGDAALRRRFADGDSGPRTSAEARSQATAQAASGSYRAAVRSLYLSALLLLEENALVTADRTLTNRELLARTAGETSVHLTLRPVVDTFDTVWYGVREPDATHFANYEGEIEALRKAVAQSTSHASATPPQDGAPP